MDLAEFDSGGKGEPELLSVLTVVWVTLFWMCRYKAPMHTIMPFYLSWQFFVGIVVEKIRLLNQKCRVISNY